MAKKHKWEVSMDVDDVVDKCNKCGQLRKRVLLMEPLGNIGLGIAIRYKDDKGKWTLSRAPECR
jgi:hypothetical protein